MNIYFPVVKFVDKTGTYLIISVESAICGTYIVSGFYNTKENETIF